MLLHRESVVAENNEVLFNVLGRLQALAHHAMTEMRALVHQLRPRSESDHNLLDLVRDFIAEREKCDALVVDLNIEGGRSCRPGMNWLCFVSFRRR